MNIDIRLPMGLMFAVLGAIIALFGLFSDPAIYERSLGFNVNLGWGLVLFVFGGTMLVLARRAQSRSKAGP